MAMEELFYFSSADLVVRVNYFREENTLHYVTHREIFIEERKIVENYLLAYFADEKTDYYMNYPSTFMYGGIDEGLSKQLRFYRVHGTLKNVVSKKQVIDVQVKTLIHKSLSNYYFDRIGDKLLELRKAIQNNSDLETLENLIRVIKEMLQAYNENTGQNVSISNILPLELETKYNRE
jgi:hypothetical protein